MALIISPRRMGKIGRGGLARYVGVVSAVQDNGTALVIVAAAEESGIDKIAAVGVQFDGKGIIAAAEGCTVRSRCSGEVR